ncbi:phage head closure protein [Lapidilactobacillus luobeiensis]|uniref:phage head closure protein n=1 Tax=Lapidilactobacillus luobeiensis TaxID=2950371 RepID=UPI0021C44CA7|nr:phage head closure protein [Lapidilactobacillus luobeiensis]
MGKRFKPSEFSHIAEFGHSKSASNNNGVNLPTFVADYKLHYAQQKRTFNQQYMIVGTQYEDTVVIITRHDARNELVARVRVKGLLYSVLACSVDDSNEAIRYDYLTLKRVLKAGAIHD